jgi:hypothetical protein
MYRIILLALALFVHGQIVMANTLTKIEANFCAKKGMRAFFEAQGDIVGLLDFDLLFSRSGISMNKLPAAKILITERARENSGRFTVPDSRNRYPVVSTKASSTSPDYTIAYGTVRGIEQLVNKKGELTGKSKDFSYKFTIWVKQTGQQCKFGVVDFERVWLLGGWIKDNL